MIYIAAAFAAIGWFEWRNLKKYKTDRKTLITVFSIGAVLFALAETFFFFRNDFQIDVFIRTVFGPVENIILMKGN